MHVKCPFSAAIAIDVEPLRQEVALGHWYIIRYQKHIHRIQNSIQTAALRGIRGHICRSPPVSEHDKLRYRALGVV